jgi:hypothetical protein
MVGLLVFEKHYVVRTIHNIEIKASQGKNVKGVVNVVPPYFT